MPSAELDKTIKAVGGSGIYDGDDDSIYPSMCGYGDRLTEVSKEIFWRLLPRAARSSRSLAWRGRAC